MVDQRLATLASLAVEVLHISSFTVRRGMWTKLLSSPHACAKRPDHHTDSNTSRPRHPEGFDGRSRARRP